MPGVVVVTVSCFSAIGDAGIEDEADARLGEALVVLGRPGGLRVAVGRLRHLRVVLGAVPAVRRRVVGRNRRSFTRRRPASPPRRCVRPSRGPTRDERRSATTAATIAAATASRTSSSDDRPPPAPAGCRTTRPGRLAEHGRSARSSSGRRRPRGASSARHARSSWTNVVHRREPVRGLLRHRAPRRPRRARSGTSGRVLEHGRRRLVDVLHRDRDEVVARRTAPRRSAARRARRRASRRP